MKSKLEVKLKTLFTRQGFNVVSGDRTLLKHNDRVYEIDLLFPEHKVAFEINSGLYHSEERVGRHYHYLKTEIAASLGIALYHLWDDWSLWKMESFIHKVLFSEQNRLHSEAVESFAPPLVVNRDLCPLVPLGYRLVKIVEPKPLTVKGILCYNSGYYILSFV